MFARASVFSVLFLLNLTVSIAQAKEPAPAAREVSLTINELVSLIVRTNPTLMTSKRTLELATASVTSAGARPNPRLESNIGRNQAMAGYASQGSVTGIGVAQLFENPALRSARVDAARSVERGSLQSVAATQNEVVAQIRLRAFEYLLRKEELVAASDALLLLQQMITIYLYSMLIQQTL